MNIVLLKMKLAGLQAAFMQEIGVYQTNWQNEVLLVPSGKSSEDYAWLGDVVGLEEWKDELIPRGLSEFSYTLKNKRFGRAMKVFVDDLNDDQYGQTKLRIAGLAQKAKAYPSTLVRDLRTNGKSGLCYDGQPFYSTTHSEGSSGTQSNLVDGTGTTDAEIVADFETGRTQLFSLVTDTGDPWPRENANLVVKCGSSMTIKLRRNLMAATVSTGGENVLSGMVSAIEEDPGISGNSWWIDDRGPMIKPFILQEREGVTLASTDPGSDTFVLTDAVITRAKWRGNGGYGQWRNSVMIDNS
jgi:phage major head subunit gpT-like protein